MYHIHVIYEYVVLQIIISSRHTVLCCAAQEAGVSHREYIDRKKEDAISHLFSPVISNPIGTSFTAEVPTR